MPFSPGCQRHNQRSSFICGAIVGHISIIEFCVFIQEAALKRLIYDIQDLLGAVTAGARSAKRHDPRGPKWNVQLVDFGKHRALQKQWVQPSDFKVTRSFRMANFLPADPTTTSSQTTGKALMMCGFLIALLQLHGKRRTSKESSPGNNLLQILGRKPFWSDAERINGNILHTTSPDV